MMYFVESELWGILRKLMRQKPNNDSKGAEGPFFFTFTLGIGFFSEVRLKNNVRTALLFVV